MNKTLIGEPWYNLLEQEFKKPYFQELIEKLREEYKGYRCCPKINDLFTVFKLCKKEDVRVVILSQDPYPFKNHAHGIAFSSLEEETPASLRYVLREVDRDAVRTVDYAQYKEFFPNNDLTPWVLQGVFLLNTVLSVRAGTPNSHAELGWQTFTKEVLRLLWVDDTPKVFLLWGTQAQDSLLEMLKEQPKEPKHLILESGHPASASHGKDKFSGNNHFSKTNRWFIKQNLTPINWKLHG